MSKYIKQYTDKEYYTNVLTELGLSESYILRHNYRFFGFSDLDDQKLIQKKFAKIDKKFTSFLNKIYRKYDRGLLISEFGAIFTKLQDIHVTNDNYLQTYSANSDNFASISYTAKASDIMLRKLKTYTEICILKNNKRLNICFHNRAYKKLIILLYYYALFIFYNSKSELSKGFENGHVDFYIYPHDLDPVCTVIRNQGNSYNEDKTQFNYDSGIGQKLNKEFNNAFYVEKGIEYFDYRSFLYNIIESLEQRGKTTVKVEKDVLHNIIVDAYKNVNIELFKKECILSKDSIESSENEIYKNVCKHRLDTTSIIDIGEKYYIINSGFTWYSKNYWANVYSIGLIPYSYGNNGKDKILVEVDAIINEISDSLVDDIIGLLKSIKNNMRIEKNKKVRKIFKNKHLDDNEWDIIAIDDDNKIVFDIESKFISTSMTESGLANDLKNMLKPEHSYTTQFEKRISIEKKYFLEFSQFCSIDDSYKIVHIMVTSKVVDINMYSDNRNFLVIHYAGLKKYLLDNYYKDSN